jgi:hypothetical protein
MAAGSYANNKVGAASTGAVVVLHLANVVSEHRARKTRDVEAARDTARDAEVSWRTRFADA